MGNPQDALAKGHRYCTHGCGHMELLHGDVGCDGWVKFYDEEGVAIGARPCDCTSFRMSDVEEIPDE